ncbi:TonB-dependent receptor domain-containing protein [Brevundimonas sp.]|uniref:TonB-dependent receptor n=1 Tax=Brevundimonas sp. TaxID=1871086 RepID=UPI00289FACF5|nr:TonB-dependent receptor [Brevundimonas sp.]
MTIRSQDEIRVRALLGLKGLLLASVFAPGLAFAQPAPQPQPAQAGAAQPQPDQTATVDDIIVTGTSRARAALVTPLAVTSLNAEALSRATASSQADILNTVPSVKAEGGGGEVAVNVFVKGLPVSGTYQLTPLQYDGIPVLSAFGLNSSAFDVYYRNDLGIERLEFVRGGVSNLFGQGSVAGLINYISKTGGDETHGVAQIEAATEGRIRLDGALNGPLSDDLHYAVSGYYRDDNGPIDTGLPTRGGQIRGNLKKDFADGRGFVALYGQYIDDSVQFYLPFPLDAATRERVPGSDGRTVYSVQTPNVRNLAFNVPGGVFHTDIARGVLTRGGQAAAVFRRDLDSGWGVNGSIKHSEYKHQFGFFLDGDGIVNTPETQAAFLVNRGLPSNATFTYADDGSALPANMLLFANRIQDRYRPVQDTTAEFNLTHRLSFGGFEHNFTLGTFLAKADATDKVITTSYLGVFTNRPRLVNLTVRDALNVPTIVSNNGLVNAGVGYTNNHHEAERAAIYFADQMQNDRWVIDLGGRVEKTRGDLKRELTSTYVTDTTTPNLSSALRDVVWGNGNYLTGKVETDSWALAAGVLYRLTPDLSLYANASRGYFFPALNTVAFNGLGEVQSYKPEVIRQLEAGVKFSGERISGSLSAFYNDLKDRRTVQFLNAGGGQLAEVVSVVSTEAYGLEGVVDVRLMENLSFRGNVSLIHHEYTAYDSAPANIGHEEPRQPSFLYNAGLYYDDGRWDGSIYTNYTGPNYTDPSNAIELDGFNVVRADLGYTFERADGRTLRLGADVFNLMNDQGITEGSPRQGAAQVSAGAYFIGRPVLPRRYTVRLTYSF